MQISAPVRTLAQCRRLTPDAPQACGSAVQRRLRTAPAGGKRNSIPNKPTQASAPPCTNELEPRLSGALRPQEVTGYADAAVRGRGCLCLAGPLSEGRAGRALLRAHRSDRPHAARLLCYRRDGQPFRCARRRAACSRDRGPSGAARALL
jgi:hypothetical protein